MRAVVRLDGACNNRCVFCAASGLAEQPFAAGEVEQALVDARRDHDEVTFAGAEPTLVDALGPLVARARALGFVQVGLQTNARRLASSDYARTLKDAGLTDVHVSLHGATAAVHEYHTGEAGSFAQTVAGVAAVRALGITVVATTVLTRSNFRVLGELPRWLLARGVAAWVVSVPVVGGRVETAFDRVVPRLAMAMPFVLHALETARAINLPGAIEGAPACLLGPLAHRALGSAPRAYAMACASCSAQPYCPGVDPAYLHRFHGDELVPRPSLPRPAGLPANLARLFVGTGPVAHVAAELAVESATETPPAPARRTLPLASG